MSRLYAQFCFMTDDDAILLLLDPLGARLVCKAIQSRRQASRFPDERQL